MRKILTMLLAGSAFNISATGYAANMVDMYPIEYHDSLVVASTSMPVMVFGKLPKTLVVIDTKTNQAERFPAICLPFEPSKYKYALPELVHQMDEIARKDLKSQTAIMCEYDATGRLPSIDDAPLREKSYFRKNEEITSIVYFISDRIAFIFTGDQKEREQIKKVDPEMRHLVEKESPKKGSKLKEPVRK